MKSTKLEYHIANIHQKIDKSKVLLIYQTKHLQILTTNKNLPEIHQYHISEFIKESHRLIPPTPSPPLPPLLLPTQLQYQPPSASEQPLVSLQSPPSLQPPILPEQYHLFTVEVLKMQLNVLGIKPKGNKPDLILLLTNYSYEHPRALLQLRQFTEEKKQQKKQVEEKETQQMLEQVDIAGPTDHIGTILAEDTQFLHPQKYLSLLTLIFCLSSYLH